MLAHKIPADHLPHTLSSDEEFAKFLGGTDYWKREWQDEEGEGHSAPDPRPFVYVCAGSVTRHYGGPEEGGWWYNTTDPVAAVPVRTLAEARAAYANLREVYAEEGYGDIFSVGGGEAFDIFTSRDYPKTDPETRPHYE